MSENLNNLAGASIFEAMNNPVLVMDKEGTIIYLNSYFEKTFDLIYSNIIGSHFLSLPSFTKKILDTETAKKQFKQLLKTKSIPSSELLLKNKNDENIWFALDVMRLQGENGKTSYIAAVMMDITASKRVQNELLKAQDELRLVLDSVPAGLWYKDSKNNFIRVNTAAAASVSLKPEDIEGKSAYELFPDQAEQYYTDDLDVLQSGRPKTGIIEPLHSKSGEMLWVETDKLPMFDEAGKVTGLLVIVSDITSRVKAEQELKEAHEELIRNERLTTLGKITGSVGHELRNPLTSIKNATYFLNMALESPDPDIQDTLNILSKEIANCERIISSLLDYARPKAPTVQKVLIHEIINGILSTLQIPNSIKVDVKCDDDLHFLLGDRHQLERAFTNLILNAVQAMPKGGQLSISAGKNKNSSIRITIADTGVGISEENMKHLFEPLFTTKSSGIGLGLVIVKSLIDAHEGTIEVKSKEREGSRFIVTLPLPDGGSKGA